MANRRQILDQQEAKEVVFDYVPKQFPLTIGGAASGFVSSQEEKSTDFKISELVAEQSGIAELNRRQVEVRVEAEALEKLKGVEEKAYSEAYELGLIEGTEKAFNDYKKELDVRISKLDSLLEAFEIIKVKLVETSEQEILKLLNLMASKIAMDHVEVHKELIINIIKKVIEASQTDEDVVIKVSPEDNMFIESAREKLGKKSDFLKRVKLESDEEIKSGGCILETQYGAIDATLEQRLAKVWEAIEAKMPRVTDEPQEIIKQSQDGSEEGED